MQNRVFGTSHAVGGASQRVRNCSAGTVLAPRPPGPYAATTAPCASVNASRLPAPCYTTNNTTTSTVATDSQFSRVACASISNGTRHPSHAAGRGLGLHRRHLNGTWPSPGSREAAWAPVTAGASAMASPGAAASYWSPEDHVSVEAKAVGCLLGALCGNVLAAPYQGDRHYQVVRYRPNGVTDFWRYDIGQQPLQPGQYTGDFGNLLAISRSLLRNRGLTTAGTLTALVESYNPEERRYNPYDKLVMDAVLAGTEPLQVPELAERYLAEVTRRNASTSSDSLEREPYGPTDLSAAARVAPVGVAYRSAGGERLLAAVRQSLEFSHPTPLGLDAAHVVAAAAAWSARQQPGDTVGCRPEALLLYLINDVAVTSDMLGKLRLLRDNLFQVGHVTNWKSFYAGAEWHALTRLLSLLSFHGYATAGSEFAAVSLLAFLTSWGRPEQAVIVAASFGGQAPATAQVVGALVGALYGRHWVPARWWDGLESGAERQDGRDGVVEAGVALGALTLAELEMQLDEQ